MHFLGFLKNILIYAIPILYMLGKQTKKSQTFFAVLVAKSEIFFEAQVKVF